MKSSWLMESATGSALDRQASMMCFASVSAQWTCTNADIPSAWSQTSSAPSTWLTRQLTWISSWRNTSGRTLMDPVWLICHSNPCSHSQSATERAIKSTISNYTDHTIALILKLGIDLSLLLKKSQKQYIIFALPSCIQFSLWWGFGVLGFWGFGA